MDSTAHPPVTRRKLSWKWILLIIAVITVASLGPLGAELGESQHDASECALPSAYWWPRGATVFFRQCSVVELFESSS